MAAALALGGRAAKLDHELVLDLEFLVALYRGDVDLGHPAADRGVEVDGVVSVGALNGLRSLEGLAGPEGLGVGLGHVVASENDVVDRRADGLAVRGLEEVARGEHE